jgi:NADPH:quinone reductase-like Zn-dependent oxidoreductase
MKAAQITAYGGQDVMQTVANAPKPSAGKDEVLVEVHAAGVNPFDWKVREGMIRHITELSFPAILGGDFAGVVTEIGEDVTGIQVGDAVYGQTSSLSGHGSFAEFTPAKTASLALMPKKLDFVQAAAVPLTAVSAYQALVEHIKLQPGQRILIHGGAGGIGSFAVQLAKHLGAYVATTATGEGIAYVTQRGADEVIDYRAQDFSVALKDFDAVYDTIGGETYAKSFQILKQGGVIVSMAAEQDEALAKQHGVRTIGQFTGVTTERLNQVSDLLNTGGLTVHVDKTFPLEQAAEALEYLHTGKHLGKVVIAVK